ncbi:hypothetical protein [Streptomyces lavenduligriseus]|uniref:Uncharacterized protein n=1 Tax=Streptomyces lavenduligriseus TaxID=67315 RepID=A0ABT0NNX2_9ACTN|nr:hypothetical protein [Streptomyces lavenduligriseus]MCL3993150.1 hypothetical protein [Streptomyces lavenduligriseus]
MKHAVQPVKATVITPSALSLLYPADTVGGYPREAFLADPADEADIRDALDAGTRSGPAINACLDKRLKMHAQNRDT